MATTLSLDRGHYLGKVVDLCYCDGIIAGATQYPEEGYTSQPHYHDNTVSGNTAGLFTTQALYWTGWHYYNDQGHAAIL
jgi:hypothetical protein